MVEFAPFLMIVLIVAIVSYTRLQRARYGIGKDGARIDDPTLRLESDRLREEMRGLKDRVAVLERIATDNNRSIDLEHEIEKLRDR